jgi:hypothetical protein
MSQCTQCKKELGEGEEFDLVRIQLWKTKAGSRECKMPDMDVTRTLCLPCVNKGQIRLSKE